MLHGALLRFAKDPRDPLLRTHKLEGKLEVYWAFSVDRDIRVLFQWDSDDAVLYNVGRHDQVY